MELTSCIRPAVSPKRHFPPLVPWQVDLRLTMMNLASPGRFLPANPNGVASAQAKPHSNRRGFC